MRCHKVSLICIHLLELIGFVASEPQLSKMLFRLGTYNRRSKRLIQMSRLYMLDPPSEHDLRPSRVKVHAAHGQLYDNTLYPSTPISHLPSAGSYALDSYRIFCTVAQDPHSEEWKSVIPSDKELIRYLVRFSTFKTRKRG